jgi:cephalosporin hydroxylase
VLQNVSEVLRGAVTVISAHFVGHPTVKGICMSEEVDKFLLEKEQAIKSYASDRAWQRLSKDWLEHGFHKKYMYNFEWLGRPIIQMPPDMVAMQELIWAVKPDLILETGIAHGGSLVLSASMLALLDLCVAAEAGEHVNPKQPRRKVLGIDIDIRDHNRGAIEAHPLAPYIHMLEGSSVSPDIVERVKQVASGYKRVLVCLDSNHTHEHVLAELQAYAPMTSVDSYCVVFDTVVDELPETMFPDRPWGPGDNPKTAVSQYLNSHPEFEVDERIEAKLMLTAAPAGYLRRTRV